MQLHAVAFVLVFPDFAAHGFTCFFHCSQQ
jgi:hypothetical protein